MDMRLLAESSKVRSSHWVAAVCDALPTIVIKWRESAQVRSHRIGLRLYAIADDPI
jgi:hypothetical protein